MKKRWTMRKALSDPQMLRDALPGDSWHAWRVLLIAMMGEELTAGERVIYKQLTGRDREPGVMVDVFLAVAGRRSGKSNATAVAIVYLATLCDWSEDLSIGERGLALFLAPSQQQAVPVFRYASTIINHVPLLSKLVAGRTADSLSLKTGVDLEVRAASPRTTRGPTCVAICLDECAFFHTADDAAASDTEIVTALKPSLATTGGPLFMTSSPAQMEGVVYRTHKRHFGPEGDSRVVVCHAATRDLNPRLSQSVIDRAIAEDPVAAEAEWMGQFRTAMTAYLARPVIERCVDVGVAGRHVLPGVKYDAFTDPAGGNGTDSFTLCVGHVNSHEGDGYIVIDAVIEIRPPFDPYDAVKRLAATLAHWGIRSVMGDHYAGLWPAAAFAKYGIEYLLSPYTKSELYLHSIALWTGGRVRLIDNQRIVDQIAGLRRKVGSNGRETVDHPRGGHDDCANVIAGLLWRLSPVQHGIVRPVAPVIIEAPYALDPFGNDPGNTDMAHIRASGFHRSPGVVGGYGGIVVGGAPSARFEYFGRGE